LRKAKEQVGAFIQNIGGARRDHTAVSRLRHAWGRLV
jgi:hypothetical protein